jgi:hypothetical protein
VSKVRKVFLGLLDRPGHKVHQESSSVRKVLPR